MNSRKGAPATLATWLIAIVLAAATVAWIIAVVLTSTSAVVF